MHGMKRTFSKCQPFFLFHLIPGTESGPQTMSWLRNTCSPSAPSYKTTELFNTRSPLKKGPSTNLLSSL